MDERSAARAEIGDLIGRYGLEFDAGNGDGVAALFTRDGVFVRPSGTRVAGARALREMVEEAEPMRHFPGPGAIDVESEQAQARSRIFVLRIDGDALRLVTAGEYRDRLVRDGGSWKFSERRFLPWIPSQLSDIVLGRSAQ